MLYKLAHILQGKFRFIWNLIEYANAMVFSMTHRRRMERIPSVLEECSSSFPFRILEAKVEDVDALLQFFSEQPESAFEFFRPHSFDAATITKNIKNKAFLPFIVVDGSKVVGYFFLRCFVNGKSFRGEIVDYRYRNKGIAKKMGLVMARVASALGLRVFGSISPDNYASLASAKVANEVQIIKTLDNGYYYVEYIPKQPS